MLTYRDYLDYSEKLLLESQKTGLDSHWLLIPATILAWSSIESFVNNMLDDFASLPEGTFQFHEKAFLLEQKLKFIDGGENIGHFELVGSDYRRLEHKIFFLLAKCQGKDRKSVKGKSLWDDFLAFKNIRNNLVHPRKNKDTDITVENVENFMETAKQVISLISINSI